MRDRLIELLFEANDIVKRNGFDFNALVMADHLLSNGVIVPPCKVGDKTFLLLERSNGGFNIVESRCVKIIDNGYGKVFSMWFDCPIIDNTLECRLDDFGKTVFLTREEAEQALRKEDEGK